MAVGSGIGGQVGFAAEPSYGTYQAPARWLEVESAALKKRKKPVQGFGLTANRTVEPALRRVITTHDAGGTVKLEAVDAGGMGLLIRHAIGSSVTTPTQFTTTTAYSQAHTIGDPAGLSLSIQVGLPNTAGTVTPYTYLGCKILETQFECGIDSILEMTSTIDAQDVTEAQALGTPSFVATANPFHFAEATFFGGAFGGEAQIDGIRKVGLKIGRDLRTDRYYQNGTGTKKEPLVKGFDKITGTIDADFIVKADLADRFRDDTTFSLIWTFTGAAIGSSGKNAQIIFALPACKIDDTFTLDGPDVVNNSLPFTVLNDLSHSPLGITIWSPDTTL